MPGGPTQGPHLTTRGNVTTTATRCGSSIASRRTGRVPNQRFAVASAAGFTQSGGFAPAVGATASAAKHMAAMQRVSTSRTMRISEDEGEPTQVLVDDFAVLELDVEPIAAARPLAEDGVPTVDVDTDGAGRRHRAGAW